MILFNDATSPFGRKVVAAALERGIALREEFVDIYTAGPVDSANPLRQIPTLVADDGTPVFDSDVIMQFLDESHAGAKLIPQARRWEVMTRMSLANGLMEATLHRIMELRRPAGEQSPSFVSRLEERIARALARIDADLAPLAGEPLRADQIAVACALEYVDLRFGDAWRARYPQLAAWLKPISARESMRRTASTRTAPVL